MSASFLACTIGSSRISIFNKKSLHFSIRCQNIKSTMAEKSKYTFSGHESFSCKALWLKKGYDFMKNNNDFNSADAVIHLGVGKNMVAAIKFWMKAFGISNEDGTLNFIGDYIFDDNNGKDKYIEDIATLWLLHYLIVTSKIASLYNFFFCGLQKELIFFTKDQVSKYVITRFAEMGMGKSINNATLEKDISVLLSNYAPPRKAKSNEDFSSLLLDLELIKPNGTGQGYFFNIEGKRSVPIEIFMYALTDFKTDDTIPYEVVKECVGLPFCMTDGELISMLKQVSQKYSNYVAYTDNSGIRQIQFINQSQAIQFLDEYYG